MKPYSRGERVSNMIQTAVTDLLSKKISDPRLEMVTISGVKMSPDLRIASIYVTVFGDERRVRDTLEGFKKSKGFIKKNIAPKLGLRFMPELRFFHDDTFDRAAHLDALIDAAPKGEGREDGDVPGAENSES